MPAANDIRIRVDRLQYPVLNLGPGRRIGLWLQGCDLGCPGCLSPALQDRRGGRVLPVMDLGDLILRLLPGHDGVTISGGEPFQQYLPLVALCSYLKAVAGVHVLVYTGYRLAELDALHPDRAFTGCIDMLVDGRYRRGRPSTDSWRGSANQRCYRFVDREPVEVAGGFPTGPWSVAVPDGSRAYLAGIPRPGDLAELARPHDGVGSVLELE